MKDYLNLDFIQINASDIVVGGIKKAYRKKPCQSKTLPRYRTYILYLLKGCDFTELLLKINQQQDHE